MAKSGKRPREDNEDTAPTAKASYLPAGSELVVKEQLSAVVKAAGSSKKREFWLLQVPRNVCGALH